MEMIQKTVKMCDSSLRLLKRLCSKGHVPFLVFICLDTVWMLNASIDRKGSIELCGAAFARFEEGMLV